MYWPWLIFMISVGLLLNNGMRQVIFGKLWLYQILELGQCLSALSNTARIAKSEFPVFDR